MRNRKLELGATVLVAFVSSSCSNESSAGTGVPVVITADALRWETSSSGVQVARLYGDPEAAGPFGLRLRYPAGYRKEPHHHPHDAFVTVLSGSYYRGYGTSFDRSRGILLVAGTFSVNPAGVSHYEWVEEPAELEVHAVGPWSSAYVDAAGNPLPAGHRADACGGPACEAAGEAVPVAERPPTVIAPGDIEWRRRSDGDEIALLYGDPEQPGPFVVRIRSRGGSRELPHHHANAAHITVLSGSFGFGIGTEYREAGSMTVRAGDLLRLRAGMPHFKWNERESIVEVHATGPWSTIAAGGGGGR